MSHANPLVLIVLSLALAACSSSGEEAAHHWAQSRAPVALPDAASTVPSILDTPSATFTAGSVQDPFAPSRIHHTQTTEGPALGNATGRWRFSDAPIDSIRVVGFLEVSGQYVAALESSTGYVNVKVGDRLGQQQLEVLEISSKGIRLRQGDGSDVWMPIGRRSR